MPTVQAGSYPVLTAPSVELSGAPPGDYQNIQARPEAFGALPGTALRGLGQGIERSADTLGHAALERQSFINDNNAQNAQNRWAERSQHLLFGNPSDPSAPKGIYELTGADAIERGKTIGPDLDKIIDEEGSGLNPMARLKFLGEVRRLRFYENSNILRHLDQQHLVYGQEVQKVAGEQATRDAGLYWNNDQKLEQAIEAGRNAATSRAQIQFGMNADSSILEGERKKSDARVIESAARAAMSENAWDRAQAIIDKYPGTLTGDQLESLQGKLRTHKENQAAENLAFPGGFHVGQALVTPQQTAEEANAQGVDPNLAITISNLESAGGRRLGARGNIFQLGDKELEGVGRRPGDFGTPQEQLQYGIRFIKKNTADLTVALGRPVTEAEAYLAHQQGVDGAVKLLSNPDKPAGSVVPAANISANKGDPSAPARAFTDMWFHRYSLASAGQSGTQLAQAGPVTQDQVPGLAGEIERIRSSNETPEAKSRAISQVEQVYRAMWADTEHQHILYLQQQKSQDDALEKEYHEKIAPKNGDPTAVTSSDILNDKRLSGAMQSKLVSFLERQTKPDPIARVDREHTAQLFDRITSDDPNKRITTFDPINKEFTDGFIKKDSLDWLEKKLTEQRTEAGSTDKDIKDRYYAVARAELAREFPGLPPTPEGLQKWADWGKFADDYIANQRKKGIPMAQIMDLSKDAPLGKRLLELKGDDADQVGKGLPDKPPTEPGFWGRIFGGGEPPKATQGATRTGPSAPIAGQSFPGGIINYDKNGNRIQ